eukprot:CAMPEP_0113700104 /NCGR_PEP_ID=MMETSP0038_2-20120614/23748_1 /TAXON_ID=2898 /ORGANISM="Cryptomonas paramecium" /LENGTH=334 /DNA_ID=CAMNT_0000623677 /DNA_START=52 /DNA_END=1053 /DNA_ORIENTATION=+ /assembly_acc=CAM_ASM_000170
MTSGFLVQNTNCVFRANFHTGQGKWDMNGILPMRPNKVLHSYQRANFNLLSGFGFKSKKDTFKYTGTQRPGVLSPKRTVPDSIVKPDYWKDGKPKARPPMMPWSIPTNSKEDIDGIRVASRMAREILDMAGKSLRVGMATDEIDKLVHEETVKRGAYPSPLNYQGYPKSVCTSINEVICHGIPSTTTLLLDGDVVNIDVTVFYNGYHGDCSEMFCVGEVDAAGKHLIKTTYKAWQAAIAICKPGVPYSEIGGVIEDIVAKEGFTTSKDFSGHGVGKIFHNNPYILHYKNRDNNGVMAPGHVFTIEPMINEGKNGHVMWRDNWTATTTDGKRSAQ